MESPSKSLTFLGLQVDALNASEAAAVVASRLRLGGSGAVVVHANLNTAYCAARDPRLLRALETPGAIVLFEGIGLKLARWLSCGDWLPDTNGTDLVPAVFSQLSDTPLRVALVGGAEGVASAAASALQQRYPHLQVVGAWNGFGDLADEPSLVAALAQARPDVLLLGLGTPLQETLAVDWASRSGARLTWAVGGLLDYWAGSRRRAPKALRLLRLEWLWRVLHYPSAYGRRYSVQGSWLLSRLAQLWWVRLAGATATAVPQQERLRERLREPLHKTLREPGATGGAD